MRIELERELSAGMREHATGLAFGRDVLAAATRRHRRRTALRRTAYATGMVGVVGALAAVVTVGGGAPVGGGGAPAPVAVGPRTTASDTPQLRLAAAAAASQNVSYRLRITTTSRDVAARPGELPPPEVDTWVTEGAFDPATATGYWNSPWEGRLRPSVASGWWAEKLVGGVRYVAGIDGRDRTGRTIAWMREEGRYDHLDLDTAMGGGVGASASPEELLQVLGQAGATVRETSPGVYHFELALTKPSRKVLADRFVGEVRVGADHRIARISYDRTSRPVRGDNIFRLTVVIEFSDYGLPVNVQPPAQLFD